MMTRDSLSTTCRLGFRIDPLRTSRTHMTAFDSDLFRLQHEREVVRAAPARVAAPTPDAGGQAPAAVKAADLSLMEAKYCVHR